MAVLIRALAVRRCGELLKQFNAKGRNQHTKDTDGTASKLSLREAHRSEYEPSRGSPTKFGSDVPPPSSVGCEESNSGAGSLLLRA